MKLGMLTMNAVADIVTRRTTFPGLCRAAAAAGIEETDMTTGEIKLYGEKKVARALAESDLKLGCLIAHVPMSDRKDDKVARLTEKSLAMARRMGSPLLMIVPMTTFGAGRLRPRDKEKIFANYARYYAAAVRAAQGSGVGVCFEDTPTCYLPLSSAAECARLLDEVSGLELVYDTANMLPGGGEPADFYEKLRARVVRAHLKDVRYVAKGQDRCADGRYVECCAFGRGVVLVRALYERLVSDGCPGAAVEIPVPRDITEKRTPRTCGPSSSICGGKHRPRDFKGKSFDCRCEHVFIRYQRTVRRLCVESSASICRLAATFRAFVISGNLAHRSRAGRRRALSGCRCLSSVARVSSSAKCRRPLFSFIEDYARPLAVHIGGPGYACRVARRFCLRPADSAAASPAHRALSRPVLTDYIRRSRRSRDALADLL